MTDQVMYYRYLARNCGIWPVARAMRKAGYSMWQCRWVLLSKEDYPVLRKVVYFGRREGR